MLDTIDEETQEILQQIVDYEEDRMKEMRADSMFRGQEKIPYWTLSDIYINWHQVKKLVQAGLIVKTGKKYYNLKDRESVIKKLKEVGKMKKVSSEKRKKKESVLISGKIPSDLFDVVEGFDDLKDFIKMVLQADEPVHVLLEGSPGTAKSLLLMELERVGAIPITAGSATKVGIRDLIFEELPKILVIDEIEKVEGANDLSSLLTWMESGRIYITKHSQREYREGKGIVFAACNSTKKLPKELLDRFQHFKLKAYTKEQFVRVVSEFLSKRKGVKKETAQYIANQISIYSLSVREAVRIASLAKTKKDVDKVLRIVKEYQ